MNVIEKYLSENKNLKLSIKSLSKKLNLKKKNVYYLCYNSKLLRKVNPLEVGSLAYKLNVFTLK